MEETISRSKPWRQVNHELVCHIIRQPHFCQKTHGKSHVDDPGLISVKTRKNHAHDKFCRSDIKSKIHKLMIHRLEETVTADEEICEGSGNGNNSDAFENILKLYVQYLGILKEIEELYNSNVYPQQREAMREIEVLVVSRIIQMRKSLCQENPSYLRSKDVLNKNSGLALKGWEYVDINSDRFSSQLKFKYSALMPTIPKFYLDDSTDTTKECRDALVKGYIRQQQEKEDDFRNEPEVAKSEVRVEIKTHQNSPLRRSNKQLADSVKPSSSIFMNDYSLADSERAATIIQKCVRGFLVRVSSKNDQSQLLRMIGMEESDDKQLKLDKVKLDSLDEMTHCEQIQNELHYKDALTELKEEVRQEKIFSIKKLLRFLRVNWVTSMINETNRIPDSLDGFYKDEEEKNSKELKTDSTNDGGIFSSLKEVISISKSMLEQNLLSEEDEKIYSEKFAKGKLEKEIEAEVRKEVDHELSCNLKRISGSGKTKSASKKKPKVSKKKNKNSQKALPGSKISDLKNIDTGHIVSILIANAMLYVPNDFLRLKDFICSNESDSLRDFLCSKETVGSITSGRGDHELPYPNLFQLKRLLIEYCILPMGCKDVKDRLLDSQHVRSVLLYGPRGSGKTLLARAVAKELGALFIDMTPTKIPDKFLKDKTEATKLIHMIFTLAKDLIFAPIVIYIGDCEKYFQSTKKKKAKGKKSDSSFASKFQKDLLIYKNQAVTNERVLIIGSSSCPWDGELKHMKWKGSTGKAEKQGFWEKLLYVPNPNYTERSLLWKHYTNKEMALKKYMSKSLQLNYNLLSQFSEGYSTGSIKSCVNKIISSDTFRTASNEEIEGNFLTEIKAAKLVTTKEEAYRKFSVDCMKEEKSVLIRKENL